MPALHCKERAAALCLYKTQFIYGALTLYAQQTTSAFTTPFTFVLQGN